MSLSAVLLVLGSALVVIGATLLLWPLGLIAAGCLAIMAGVDLRPSASR